MTGVIPSHTIDTQILELHWKYRTIAAGYSGSLRAHARAAAMYQHASALGSAAYLEDVQVGREGGLHKACSFISSPAAGYVQHRTSIHHNLREEWELWCCMVFQSISAHRLLTTVPETTQSMITVAGTCSAYAPPLQSAITRSPALNLLPTSDPTSITVPAASRPRMGDWPVEQPPHAQSIAYNRACAGLAMPVGL